MISAVMFSESLAGGYFLQSRSVGAFSDDGVLSRAGLVDADANADDGYSGGGGGSASQKTYRSVSRSCRTSFPACRTTARSIHRSGKSEGSWWSIMKPACQRDFKRCGGKALWIVIRAPH